MSALPRVTTWIDRARRAVRPIVTQTQAPAPAPLDWSLIDAILDTKEGKQTQVQLRKWATEAGWTGELIDEGSRKFTAEAWFTALYQAEERLNTEPTEAQAEAWDKGGATEYWAAYQAAYSAKQIALIALCFIRTRLRREGIA